MTHTNLGLTEVSSSPLSRVDDIIGRFITSCSHSMRGPLKSIAGLVNLLQAKSCTETDRQQFLDLIARTSLKMENMLDELEHFLENTKRDMNIKEVDLPRLVASILQTNKSQLESLGMSVDIKVQPGIEFFSDPHRVRLILSNLIANAIHFHDLAKAVKTLEITAMRAGKHVEIRVADNGIGIDPICHEKIFQLFYRGSERSGGAGIGLYVVREVVRKMGGSIKLVSEVGRGAEFIMQLPDLTPDGFPQYHRKKAKDASPKGLQNSIQE